MLEQPYSVALDGQTLVIRYSGREGERIADLEGWLPPGWRGLAPEMAAGTEEEHREWFERFLNRVWAAEQNERHLVRRQRAAFNQALDRSRA